jgi:hypothetical protein
MTQFTFSPFPSWSSRRESRGINLSHGSEESPRARRVMNGQISQYIAHYYTIHCTLLRTVKIGTRKQAKQSDDSDVTTWTFLPCRATRLYFAHAGRAFLRPPCNAQPKQLGESIKWSTSAQAWHYLGSSNGRRFDQILYGLVRNRFGTTLKSLEP